MNMTQLRTLFLVFFGLLLFAGGSISQEAAPPTADGALRLLKDGNGRFATDKLAAKDIGAQRRAALAKGQKPFAIVLTCADSRVAPELIFDQGLGELFVLRVAGNLTDPFILGSIEYAVEHLHAPLIVVLGHESCGAVAAALAKQPLPGNLGKLVKEVHIGKDLPTDKATALPIAVKNNVVFYAGQLTERSELLKEEVAHKKVKIVGGVYRLASGKVEWLEGK
jgi:carbonic anhydrase